MGRILQISSALLAVIPSVAMALPIDFRCGGRSYAGTWQRDVFSMRLSVQNGALTDWSFIGDVPFQLLALQSMKNTVPFNQSCKIVNGYPAKSCDFRVARSSIILVQVQDTSKSQDMGFMIEQNGAQPLLKKFRYTSYMGRGAGAADGVCVAK